MPQPIKQSVILYDEHLETENTGRVSRAERLQKKSHLSGLNFPRPPSGRNDHNSVRVSNSETHVISKIGSEARINARYKPMVDESKTPLERSGEKSYFKSRSPTAYSHADRYYNSNRYEDVSSHHGAQRYVAE